MVGIENLGENVLGVAVLGEVASYNVSLLRLTYSVSAALTAC